MARSRLKSPRLHAWALGSPGHVGSRPRSLAHVPSTTSGRSHDSYARVRGRVARPFESASTDRSLPIPLPRLDPGVGDRVTYLNGEEAGLRTILESLGGGVAIFDYDSDGRADLFFTGGGGFRKSSAGFHVQGLPNRLWTEPRPLAIPGRHGGGRGWRHDLLRVRRDVG